jgi:hypothetical protein
MFVAFCSVVLMFLTFGCGVARYSHVYERPRLYGDVNIVKMNPVPIVQSNEYAPNESVISADTKLEGVIFNEQGRCTIAYELPLRNPDDQASAVFEYRAKVTPGPCPGDYARLKLGEELAVEGAQMSYRHTTEKTVEICEVWKPALQVRVPPGMVSPRLRVLGGATYAINYTQASSTGRIPYTGVYYLNVDFGLQTMRRGTPIDWGIVFNQCYAN